MLHGFCHGLLQARPQRGQNPIADGDDQLLPCLPQLVQALKHAGHQVQHFDRGETALDAIASHPGQDQAHVAQLIAYDRATIGGVIERTEHKGWIRRVVSERDRRARELSLTPEGVCVHAALLPIVKGLQDEILGPLGAADRARLIKLVRQAVGQ